jgi:hypothetical protein
MSGRTVGPGMEFYHAYRITLIAQAGNYLIMTDCRYITAIAGSASSLRPLKEFFDHTPHDNVAYVIVQHLPIGFRSQLQAILRLHSSLETTLIEDGMPVTKDKIFILPPSHYAGIRAGFFTMAQDPETCEYPVMPKMANATVMSTWYCPAGKCRRPLQAMFYGMQISGTADGMLQMRSNNVNQIRGI